MMAEEADREQEDDEQKEEAEGDSPRSVFFRQRTVHRSGRLIGSGVGRASSATLRATRP